MIGSLATYTAPAVEPVTLAEARRQLGLSSSPNFAAGVADQTCTLPVTGSYTLTITGAGSVAIAAGTAVGSGWATATADTPKTVVISTAGTVTLDATGVVSSITLSPVSTDDTLITALIKAAREACEAITWRAFITQTIDWTFDAFPDVLTVPRPNLQSVTHIKYIDTAGVQQTITASEYTVDATSHPGRITPAYGYSWPSVRGDIGGITVRFIAGYGDAAANVPEVVRTAILLEVERLFSRDPKTMDGLERARDALLALEQVRY